jgi:hypothetical protein
LNSWPTSSSAALGVEHGRHAELFDLADQDGVEVGIDPAREAAGEHAHAGPLREVQQLLVEQVELLG